MCSVKEACAGNKSQKVPFAMFIIKNMLCAMYNVKKVVYAVFSVKKVHVQYSSCGCGVHC